MPEKPPPQAPNKSLDKSEANERIKLATEFSGAEIVTEFVETLQTRSPATREVYRTGARKPPTLVVGDELPVAFRDDRRHEVPF